MQDESLEQTFLRFREGADLRALAKVFDAVAGELLAIARHLAPQRQDAEDLVQATFLTAIHKAPRFDGRQSLMPWLLGILARHAHELRRKQGRTITDASLEPAELDEPEREARAKELAVAVASAIDSMPEAYKTIVRRHLVDGTTPRELGRELGISNVHARVRLHRGLKLLRRSLAGGFASFGAWFPLGRQREMRKTILRHAAAHRGVAVPMSVSPLAVCAVVSIAGVAVSSAAWKFGRPSPATQREVTAAALEPNSGDARASRSLDADLGTSNAQPAARTAAPTAHSIADRTSTALGFTLRGRMLLPDGGPAADTRITCAAAEAAPDDWSPPAPVLCASDGRFELTCDAPAKLLVRMTAEHERCATIHWRWSDLGARGGIELGDVAFEPAGTLAVAIVDGRGHRSCAGWQLDLFDASESRRQGQEQIWRRVDGADAESIVLDDLAPRRYSVRATHGFVTEIAWSTVDVAASRVSQLELRYQGPDPGTRIGIALRCRPSCATSDFAPEHLRLAARDGSVRVAAEIPHIPDRFVFEDVAGDGYELVVDDGRFTPWKRSGVRAGDNISVELVGAASIALRVRDGAGRKVEHYSLSATCISPDRSSAAAQRLALDDEPPRDGVFDGFLPGAASLEVGIDGSRSKTVRVDGLRAGEVRAVEVTFGAGLAIAGHVFESDGETPSAGASVQLARAGGPQASSATRIAVEIGAETAREGAATILADSAGAFRFADLEPGRWKVRAIWNPSLAIEREVALDEAGALALELVQPPCGWIEGLVSNCTLRDEQRLVVVACVEPFDATMPRVEVDANRDGSFRIGPLPPGRFRVEAFPKPARAEGWGKGTRVFSELTEHSNERNLCDVATGRTARVLLDGREITGGRARIHVELDGAPRAGTLVARSANAGEIGRSVEVRAVADVGDDGVVVLDGLRTGSYDLSVAAANGAWAWRGGQPLELFADREVTLELRVVLATRRVRFVDAGGAPLARKTSKASSGGISFESMTDDSGEIELTLPIGPVRIELLEASVAEADVDWRASSEPLVLRAVAVR